MIVSIGFFHFFRVFCGFWGVFCRFLSRFSEGEMGLSEGNSSKFHPFSPRLRRAGANLAFDKETAEAQPSPQSTRRPALSERSESKGRRGGESDFGFRISEWKAARPSPKAQAVAKAMAPKIAGRRIAWPEMPVAGIFWWFQRRGRRERRGRIGERQTANGKAFNAAPKGSNNEQGPRGPLS